MKYEEIIAELSKKIYKPVYLLMGDEPYYIDLISDYFAEHVLNETEKTFNQTVIYGKDADVSNIINAAKRYPMMSNYQLVLVREAQELKKIEDLIYYVEKPLQSTILVICFKYKNLDKRKKLYTTISKTGVVFESKKMYDDKLPAWIEQYLKGKGCAIDLPATNMLAEFIGNDLSKMVNELDKLLMLLPQNSKKITAELIEKNIGFSKEFNNFELQNAIIGRNIARANLIVSHFAKSPNNYPLPLTMASLYNYFSKLLIYHANKTKQPKDIAAILKINPFFLKDYRQGASNYSSMKIASIISDMREYDLKSKGVNNASASHGELLKELVYKILH